MARLIDEPSRTEERHISTAAQRRMETALTWLTIASIVVAGGLGIAYIVMTSRAVRAERERARAEAVRAAATIDTELKRLPRVIDAIADDLSSGRLVLGIGAGWQEREHHNFGIDFPPTDTRFRMLDEYVQVVTQLLRSDEPVTFKGQYYTLDDAILLPRPRRPGGPPILIGGNGERRKHQRG